MVRSIKETHDFSLISLMQFLRKDYLRFVIPIVHSATYISVYMGGWLGVDNIIALEIILYGEICLSTGCGCS